MNGEDMKILCSMYQLVSGTTINHTYNFLDVSTSVHTRVQGDRFIKLNSHGALHNLGSTNLSKTIS